MMEEIKVLKKDIEMKVINSFNTLKDQIKQKNRLRTQDDCPEIVKKAIETINHKMTLSKFSQLHPPFMPKTLTRFRHQYFLPVKKQYHNKLNDKNPSEFKHGLNLLHSFIANLDCQSFDLYLEQIRQPYIRKMFNENYEFDQIDFKEINSQYKIRAQIQNLLNSASEWLIQIERTQDLLERIQLYFDIKTPLIIQRVKKEGIEGGSNRTWSESFLSLVRKVSSYSLRKSSKIIQSSLFTTIAPAAAMLTIAIVGGGSTLPFSPALNSKYMVTPIIAIAIPYLLDGLASTIERKQFMQKLEEWAISLEQISGSIAKFNNQMEETIILCSTAADYQSYSKQKLNMEKYVNNLNKNIASLTDFNQTKFQQMRDRTEAYFRKYIEIADGQWTVVIPQQDFALTAGHHMKNIIKK